MTKKYKKISLNIIGQSSWEYIILLLIIYGLGWSKFDRLRFWGE